MLNTPPNALISMAVVLGLLCFASITRLVLSAVNQDKDYTELRQRTQSWWLMVATVFVVLITSKQITIVFFGILSFLALKELLSIVPTRQSDRRVIFWAYASIPIQYYWIAQDWYGMFLVFIPIYMFLLLPMRMVLTGETKGFIHATGVIHWAIMLTVFGLSHIAYLVMLPVQNEMAGHMGPVLFLLFTTQLNDVCQYVCGKLLGKKKILPKVSPNKTWEGFLGGMILMTLISGFTAPLLTPLSQIHGFMIGALLSLAGFVGDVVISSVKRDLKIKDCGTLIPGHGGVMDRLDSLTYTAPIFFHYLYYFYY